MAFVTSNKTGDNVRYDGVYKGIVVENVDTEIPKSGRVKVWVPEIYAVKLDGIMDITKKPSFSYKFPGSNIVSDLTPDNLKRVKDQLPWAILSSPIVGGGAPGKYFKSKGMSTVGESVNVSTLTGTDITPIPSLANAWKNSPPVVPTGPGYGLAKVNAYNNQYLRQKLAKLIGLMY
jgi:hypothetical protein